jgi:adenylate kinase family enzyme
MGGDSTVGAVPVLSVDSPMPRSPQRIIVAGTSGSGKTTVAVRIATILGIRHVEIDALFHGPGWSERTTFLDDVRRFAAEPQWVTEWQYPAARPLLAARADLLVWLDLPTGTVLRRVLARTVRRRLRREVLWNDNVEPPFRTILTDPDHIVRWTWTHRRDAAQQVVALLVERPEFPVVRLISDRQVARWLDRLQPGV